METRARRNPTHTAVGYQPAWPAFACRTGHWHPLSPVASLAFAFLDCHLDRQLGLGGIDRFLELVFDPVRETDGRFDGTAAAFVGEFMAEGYFDFLVAITI